MISNVRRTGECETNLVFSHLISSISISSLYILHWLSFIVRHLIILIKKNTFEMEFTLMSLGSVFFLEGIGDLDSSLVVVNMGYLLMGNAG
jgi:hypothetical protein